MFDYRQLEALGAVIDCGGFDRASDILGLTQAAVTLRIKQLETFAGKPLLIRSNPPVPTEEGRILHTHFKKIRLLEEDLDKEWNKGVLEKPLPIGVNASTLGSWFLPALRYIMKSTLVDIHVGEAKVVHDLLQQGSLAGCLSIRASSSRGCYVEYLGQLVLRCIASRDFKQRHFPQGVTAEAMKSAPAILFHQESQMMQFYQKTALNITPFDVPAHVIPSQDEYLKMIMDGAAYGFLPESLFKRHQADGELIDLSPLSPIELPQYWHRWGMESEKLELITMKIREEARASLQQNKS
ncbi:MAG: ArgP/LysG family DNA-binding transcriptional regulator [Spirochaetales bacterium]|nr:ArgP/LysG family DNA-binding transcriptional regulator [Spirochaetales bacterium]